MINGDHSRDYVLLDARQLIGKPPGPVLPPQLLSEWRNWRFRPSRRASEHVAVSSPAPQLDGDVLLTACDAHCWQRAVACSFRRAPQLSA